MMAAIQKQLGGLVGTSSGYFESLPKQVQQRVKALKFLHSQRTELEKKFNQELLELEKKYEALYQPLIERRSDIVSGASEPKPEELVEEKKEEDKEDEKKEKIESDQKKEEKPEKDVKGIPEFWLEALKHHEEFASLITEKDEPALKHLENIKLVPVPENDHSFAVEFYFSDNEFFDNKIVKKTYILNENPEGDVMYDHVEATQINWKNGKNLTIRKVTKQQKKKGKGKRGGKSGGPAQTITVEEPTESFFHFFNPEGAYALYNGDDQAEFDDYGLQEFLESDYEMGLELKEKIIPHAVMWYTGENAPLPNEEDDDEEDDEDEEENSDDEENKALPPTKDQSAEQTGNNPECKQQ